MGPQLKVVEKTRTATMLCAASGNPDPEISWFKDMLPVDISSSNGRIKQLRSGTIWFDWCLFLVQFDLMWLNDFCVIVHDTLINIVQPSFRVQDAVKHQTDTIHVRHEDVVKTQKAFVVTYDFMYSLSSQKTWKINSKFVTLISQRSSYRTAAAHFQTQHRSWNEVVLLQIFWQWCMSL